MIKSATNNEIKNLKKLISSSKYRRDISMFVVEGFRGVCEVPHNLIDTIFYTEGKYFDLSKFYSENDEIKFREISESLANKISATKNPQGILALCKMPQISNFNPSENDLVLVLDRVNDPGNLGTIIRSARAAGVAYIVLLKGSVDLYNDKVIRSSMGAIFKQKIIFLEDIDFVLERIKTKVYATVVDGTKSYYDCKFARGACIVLGNEANGISDEILSKIENKITIPMLNDSESLNLAVSASVIIFEAARQREKMLC